MEQKAVTAAEMKALERAADEAGLSYRQMMANAGRRAFEAARRRWPQAKSAATARITRATAKVIPKLFRFFITYAFLKYFSRQSLHTPYSAKKASLAH